MALILTQSEVRSLLPMRRCMDLMKQAFKTLGRKQAVNPLRWCMEIPGDRGILGLMPGYMEDPQVLGLKVIAVFPGNDGTDYDSHQGLVALFDVENGSPIAIMDASEITAIRTAAATGVATELLAREDAGKLALIGSGVQARTHLRAMLQAREISKVRVFSPNIANREAFAKRESERHAIEVEAVGSAREAVEDADIICTTTSASDPVLLGEWITPGTHLNAVGSSVPSDRELDTAAVAMARLYVDRRESALNEAGDFMLAKQEGAIDDSHIVGEIGELLLGEVDGRRNAEEVTLFKSLGLAVEDLAAAHHVYARAKQEGVGTEVDLGGMRDAPA
jgi:alanine dehydrogenase